MAPISEDAQAYFLSVVKTTIEHGMRHDAPPILNPWTPPDFSKVIGEVQVSLVWPTGSLTASNHRTPTQLWIGIRALAFEAALRKPQRVCRYLLDQTTVRVEICESPGRALVQRTLEELEQSIYDGETIALSDGTHSALAVASSRKYFDSNRDFLCDLRTRAGIPEDVEWQRLFLHVNRTRPAFEAPYQQIQCLPTD